MDLESKNKDKEAIPGSRRSMRSYIQTYFRFWKDVIVNCVFNRGDFNICFRGTTLRVPRRGKKKENGRGVA